jgi:putative FmdB family regulatory protein
MPLHEYNCRGCGQTFEVLVTAKSAPEVQCPGCLSPAVDRLIGLPGPGRVVDGNAATNCRGDGPPCGIPRCGRKG